MTSAISTTGLVTVPTGDSYTLLGQFVHLLLFQLGGVGYMTISSFVVLARGGKLSPERAGILKTGFALPGYFPIDRFVYHVIAYTLTVEALGTAVLWWEFSSAGEATPLWSAIFHCVSAFATAGFGLHGDSLERFAWNVPVNLTIGVLSYLGAIGFIVFQDVYYSLRNRERMMTLTSKVILVMTVALFIVCTPVVYFIEPSFRSLPLGRGLIAAAFQVMTASTTAGFNTVPIGPLTNGALWLIVILMVIGASPSGTGGGLKTTSVSAVYATIASIVRRRGQVSMLGYEVPSARLLVAMASIGFYLTMLTIGVLLLCISEQQSFLALLFEAASGLGTVGLSMGITGEVTTFGKVVLIVLMFAGRVGPITLGLAMFRPEKEVLNLPPEDLAV
jgi:trk system potassium uptake protein TrkH